MSWPSSVTVPDTRAVGTVSCIRFRQRSRVDLPQPDGPMIAVTSRSRNAIDTPRMTSAVPKNALTPLASSRTRASASGCAAGAAGAGRGTRGDSVATAPESGPGREAGRKADDEDNADEDERASPGQRVLLVVRADREGEDLQWQRGDRLAQRHGPELVAQHGEQQRCGFPGDARHRNERAGDDAGQRRAEDQDQRGAPARVA